MGGRSGGPLRLRSGRLISRGMYEDWSTDVISADALQRHAEQQHRGSFMALEVVFDVAVAPCVVARNSRVSGRTLHADT